MTEKKPDTDYVDQDCKSCKNSFKLKKSALVKRETVTCPYCGTEHEIVWEM